MAANVNKKFVILLTVGVVVAVGLAAGVLVFAMKSAKDLADAGDKFMAAGDPIKAAASYSKAVNKEGSNVEFIEKWIKAIAAMTPSAQQEYTDRFRELNAATRRLAEVKRTDVAAHRAMLDPNFQDIRRGGANAQAWTGMIQLAEASMKLFPDGNKGIDGLRRYRGIARTALMSGSQRLTDEEIALTRADLEAAIAYDPNDEFAAAGLTDFFRLLALKARGAADPEGAVAFMAQAKASADASLARMPGSSIVKASVLNLESVMMAETAKGTMNAAQFVATMTPKIEEFLSSVEKEDPAKVDLLTAAQATELALNNRIPNAVERGVAVFDKIVAARGNSPMPRYFRASFLFNARRYRDAAEGFQSLIDIPNLPVSFDGISLFTLRDVASVRKVDAMLGVWEVTTDSAERLKVLTEVKATRDAAKARTSVEDTTKLLLDGKVAMAENQLTEARKLLGQYNQRTANNNVEALLLLAKVLERQNLQGEALQCYRKIIENRQANLNTYLQKANLEIELKNWQNAYDDLQNALSLSPDNPGIKQQIERVTAILSGGQNTTTGVVIDPLVKILADAENLANRTPPDTKGAVEKLKEARPLVKDAAQFIGLAQVLVRLNNVPEALASLEEGLKKFPEDTKLVELKKALETADPVGDAVKRIMESSLTAVEKEVECFRLYARVGKEAEAVEHLDRAEKLNPDNPTVIATRFEQALGKKDAVKAREIAARAKTLDLDKVGGRVYDARVLQLEGKYAEAAALVEQAAEIDPANPALHRLIGQLYLGTRELPKAMRALERALQIQPQDAQTLSLYMRALMSTGQATAALERARDALKFGINDDDFVQLWLNLEFELGDKAKAVDRRTRIFEGNPANNENAVALATILLRDAKLEEAGEVIAALETNKAAEAQGKFLRAALVGARGDIAGSEAIFDEGVSKLNQNDMDGQVHLDFARLVSELGQVELASKILEKGRRYQKPDTMLVDRTLGDTFFGAGNWVKALEAYGRAKESVKSDPSDLLSKRMIECTLRLERLDDAQKLLAKLNPEQTSDVQVILLASDLARQRGDDAREKMLLDKAVGADRGSDVALVRRGDANVNDAKLFEDAMADYEAALRINPRSTRARLMYAECWTRKGDVQRAVDELQAGLRLDALNAEWRNMHVRLLLNLGRVADAISSLNEMMSKTTDARWPQMAGFIYLSAGDPGSAVGMFQKGWETRRGPISGKALVDALLMVKPVNLAAVRQIVDAPEFMADTEPYSRLTRARVLMMEKKPEAATADVKAALAMIDVTQLREGFIALDEIRRVWESPADVANALDAMAPADGWPEAMKMNITMQRLRVEGQKARALADFEELSKSKNKEISISSLSVLGTSYFNAGDPNKSVEAYQRGLALEPNNKELLNNLAFVMSKGLKQHAEAMVLAKRAVEQDPTNSAVIDTLGAIKLELGQLEEAAADFERARTLSADLLVRAMPTVHLVEVRLKQGKPFDADQLLKELDEAERRDQRVKANYAAEIQRVKDLRKQVR